MQFLNMFSLISTVHSRAVFLIGSWLRYDYGQYTWRAASSQMLDRKGVLNLRVEPVPYRYSGDFCGHFSVC